MSVTIQGQLAQIRMLLGLNGEQMQELCDRLQVAAGKGYSVDSLILECLNRAMSGRSYSSILEYLSN